MNLYRSNIAFLTTLFLLCSFSSLRALPAQVIIIRHAQDSPEGTPNLSTQGFERADALDSYFQLTPEVTAFGLPVALYCVKPASVGSSIRTRETLQPLAASLGLPIHAPVTKTMTTELANLILSNSNYDNRMVLICWQHLEIPDLAQALGVASPPHFPGSRFDETWVITYTDPANPTLVIYDQALMHCDLPVCP